MDPDEELAKLRDHVNRWESDAVHDMTQEQLLEQYSNMAESFKKLDQWLSRGAQLPIAWV
jgi:hypothetical protein